MVVTNEIPLRFFGHGLGHLVNLSTGQAFPSIYVVVELLFSTEHLDDGVPILMQIEFWVELRVIETTDHHLLHKLPLVKVADIRAQPDCLVSVFEFG